MIRTWELIAYTAASILIVLSLFFVMMFGINYGYIKGLTWISVFIIFTVKRHVLLDNFFALVYSLRDIYKSRMPPKDVLFDDEIPATDQHELDISKRRVDIVMEKLWNKRYMYDEQSESEKQERERLNIYYSIIFQDFFMFFFYMVTLLLIVLGSRDSLAYYSTMNVKELVSSYKFGYNIRRVQTDEQVYSYIRNLVRNINRATDINGQNITNEFGWVSGGRGKILGVIRLRQHRMPPNQCTTGQLRKNCVGTFHSFGRDTESYSQEWQPKVDWFYEDQFWRLTVPWIYTDGIESRSVPYFGDMGFYVGGGYIAQLGRTYNNSRAILSYLKKSQWLDRRTIVLFIEFTLYNCDANLFNIVSIVLEKTPQGLFEAVVKILSLKLLLILEHLPWQVKLIFVLFLVLTTIFFYRLSVTVWNGKFKLFISKPWNVVDVTIIVITIITLALFFTRNNYVIGLIQELKNKKKNDFVSFQFAALYDAFLAWISAFLVLLATIRLWKILNFAKMFRVLANTLWHATVPLIVSLILALVLIVGLSICLTIISGGSTKMFQYLEDSLVSVMSFSIGFGEGVDAESLFIGGKIVGILLYAIGIIAICIIAIFLVATTLCYHFSKEKDYVEKHAMPLYSFWTFLKEEIKIKPKSRRTGCRLDVPLHNKEKISFLKNFSTQRCGGDYTASKAKLINEAIDAQIDYLNKYIDELSRAQGKMSVQK